MASPTEKSLRLPRRPLGQPPQSAAARSWPHFVPRIELDAQLDKLRVELRELGRRQDRREAHSAEIECRFEALRGHCDKYLATQATMDYLHDMVPRQIGECRRDLNEKIEALAGQVAFASIVELLRANHGKELEAHRVSLDELSRKARELSSKVEAAMEENKASFISKSDFSIKTGELEKRAGTLEEMQADFGKRLEIICAKQEAAGDDIEELRSNHDDLAQSASVTSASFTCVKSDLDDLSRRCNAELATTGAVAEAKLSGEQAKEAATAAASDLAALRREANEDFEFLKRTAYAQSICLQDFRTSVDAVAQAARVRGELHERLEAVDRFLVDFARRLGLREAEWREDVDALRQEHIDLESSQLLLKQETLEHVERLEEATEATRQYSTTFSLQQLDNAIRFARSVEKLEKAQSMRLSGQV